MIKYKDGRRLCFCDVCGAELDASHAPKKALHVCIKCAPSQADGHNVWVGDAW